MEKPLNPRALAATACSLLATVPVLAAAVPDDLVRDARCRPGELPPADAAAVEVMGSANVDLFRDTGASPVDFYIDKKIRRRMAFRALAGAARPGCSGNVR